MGRGNRPKRCKSQSKADTMTAYRQRKQIKKVGKSVQGWHENNL